MLKNQVVSAVVPTALRHRCMAGTGVARLTRRTRITPAMNTSPMRPRKNTTSKLVKWVDANLMHTPMVANSSDASSIQRACIVNKKRFWRFICI